MTNTLRQIGWIGAVIALLSISACATQRSSQPRVTASERGIELNTPVLVSVLDARGGDAQDAAPQLKTDLTSVYGDAIETTDYFAEIPDDRVAVRIRLKANDATFGSRIISVSTVEQSYATAQAKASGPWSSVVGTASSQSTMLSSTVQTEGWWIGTSWMKITVVDRRGSTPQEMTLPLVAETKRSNTFGYRTASRVTDESWSDIERQLIQIMDQVLMTVRQQ
jgi:hypothetical protein